ncbi:Bifunctional inhibitor/plant lipid transfer protein/seed storage helical domain containing protein [Trema orientale]|uniref:Bifunctional inhibitor/plant lipid transfer protein/seed storage helical domain containing protein n=1 Tax=Trema orientale TaxID=63057 RepID=A0A2P5F039_TREOI|nr:Bifunctional inhibitor/plant lipid transfer protein/seed storage helical domain containing protein [Trema orientale]
MKKNMSSLALCAVAVVAAVVLLSEAPTSEAVTCSVYELSSCLSAITYGTTPSSQCCSKLYEQKPCLCGYLKDPNLSQYVNSANAKKVAYYCNVSYPSCS